ncbi:MAG: DUF3575 domain-containing protein [Acidobacteria bacterium]|nr:DUF3575 domain-containing protein [Acidobacteriota bacterium]
MKKSMSVLFIVLILAPLTSQAISLRGANYLFTTDILEILDSDFQLEFEYVLNSNWSFTMRAGYYRHLEDSEAVYANNKRHWEIGARYRFYPIDTPPNLLFLGIGFDNRPQDNTITPTAEIGFQVPLRPIVFSVVGFGGFEWHFKNAPANRWVTGVELRAGICF